MKRFILTKTPHIPQKGFFSKTEIQGKTCMTSYDYLHVYTMAQKTVAQIKCPNFPLGLLVDTAFASSVLISQDVKLAKQSRVVHFLMDRQEYHKTDESQLKLSILLFRRLK